MALAKVSQPALRDDGDVLRLLVEACKMANSIRKHALGTWQLRIPTMAARGVLFAVLCLFAAFRCSAQDTNCLSVRVLDAKSGKPIKSLLVYVATRSEHLGNYTPIGKTDGKGVVRFCPQDPIPTSFRLEFDHFYQTDPSGLIDTKAILEQGSVAGNIQNKGKFHDRETLKPGEMVIFGSRWWWIDRMLEKWFGEWP